MDVLDDYPDEKELRALDFIPSGHGWATGISGLTLKTHFPVNIETTYTDYDLNIFPNPCAGEVRLQYLIRDICYLISDLYMISGSKIRELISKKAYPGEYEMEIDVSDLPAGVYFIRLQAGNEVVVRKLVVGG